MSEQPKFRLSRNPRDGMHIVQSTPKNNKRGVKGLCGRSPKQDWFHLLSAGPLKQSKDDAPFCPACYGHYAKSQLESLTTRLAEKEAECAAASARLVNYEQAIKVIRYNSDICDASAIAANAMHEDAKLAQLQEQSDG